MDLEFQELLSLLQDRDESERIEAKRSAERIGASALETICAFSNEPGLNGGYLVFGLTKNDSKKPPYYHVTGVSDPDKLQNELVCLCRENFNKTVRPIIDVIRHSESVIIVAYIPEAEPFEKPIYIKKLGIENGVFRRIGPTDQLCRQEDLDLLYKLRSQKKFDETILENASWKDFDAQAIAAYRQYRKEANGNAKELTLTDQELMIALGAAIEINDVLKPTVAGIILFGSESALRRLFPIASKIDYIIVEGREWVPHPERRYSQSYEFREALILAFHRIVTHVMRDIPQAFSMQPNGIFRKDVPLIPHIVIREAICNAVMHRDYRAGQSIQIVRYSNRIEFLNPGYSLKPEDQLGLPGSITRNDKIAIVLHDLHISEIKGTGIRTMREAMRDTNLSLPFFESDRSANKFVLTLLTHHFFDEKDFEWLKMFKGSNLTDEEARALIAVREMGAITNSDYRNINCVDTLSASTNLRRLRDCGILEHKGKSSQTYYVLKNEFSIQGLTPHTSSISEGLTPHTSSISEGLTPHTSNPASLNDNDLTIQLQKIGKKTSAVTIKEVIRKLCSQHPLKSGEIAALIHRNPRYVRDKFLTPMVEAGDLELTFPNNPAHPLQAYKAKSK